MNADYTVLRELNEKTKQKKKQKKNSVDILTNILFYDFLSICVKHCNNMCVPSLK